MQLHITHTDLIWYAFKETHQRKWQIGCHFFFTPMLFMLLLVWLEAIRWFANCDKINTTNNNNVYSMTPKLSPELKTLSTIISSTPFILLIQSIINTTQTIYAAIFDHHTWSQMMYVTLSLFVPGMVHVTARTMILYYSRAYSVN